MTKDKNYLKDELNEAGKLYKLSPEYKKRKLVIWIVIVLLGIIIYGGFWSHPWLKWTLLITLPWALLWLRSILKSATIIQRRIPEGRRRSHHRRH